MISANQVGIDFQYPEVPSTPVQNDVVQGNLIGTDKTGKLALGNKDDGIFIYSGNGITIGGTGPGQGNVIAFNGQFGIDLGQGQQDQFTQNSIFGNKTAGNLRGLASATRMPRPPVLTFTPGIGRHRHALGHAHLGCQHNVRRSQSSPTPRPRRPARSRARRSFRT